MAQLMRDGRWTPAIAVVLAAALLAATLSWHVPMMLWDHLDLVPMYDAWQQGDLWDSEIARVHDGSHLHLAAYLVLLGTTWLSGGQPWLDCLVNWSLLLVYAWLMVRLMARALPEAAPAWLRLVMLALVLYPGHLANLQWGWQIAVFLCLLGIAVAVWMLSGRSVSWWVNLLAVAAAAVATLSFTTGLALVPMALLLLLMRPELSRAQLAWRALPWCLLGAFFVWLLMPVSGADGGSGTTLAPGLLALYALNFVGGGIARFATGAAPVLSLLAMASAGWFAWRLHHDPRRLGWVGLMVFAIGAGLLTAFGRAAVFGAEHAFVTRYVSFSSLFWIGWFGLLLLALPGLSRPWRRTMLALAGLFVACALFNAVHMVKKAAEVAARAERTAQTIRDQYPNVDEGVLGEIYFGRVEAARERLQRLHALGFAPFQPVPVEAPPASR